MLYRARLGQRVLGRRTEQEEHSAGGVESKVGRRAVTLADVPPATSNEFHPSLSQDM